MQTPAEENLVSQEFPVPIFSDEIRLDNFHAVIHDSPHEHLDLSIRAMILAGRCASVKF